MRIAIVPCALLVLLGVAACRDGHQSQTTFQSIGAATLVSAADLDPSTKREVPLYHVLFVPDLDPPQRGSHGTTGAGGGTGDDVKIRYGYYEDARNLTIESQPVYVHNRKKLEAGGRSFDLAQGNVFLANVSLTGALDVTQLPPMGESHDVSAYAVLEHIKTSMPANARVQALNLPQKRVTGPT
jgi:hypothetical protein